VVSAKTTAWYRGYVYLIQLILSTTDMMKNKLNNVQRTLHDLWKALPAIKATGSKEAMRKHVALIRFYQQQYDRLISQQPLPA